MILIQSMSRVKVGGKYAPPYTTLAYSPKPMTLHQYLSDVYSSKVDEVFNSYFAWLTEPVPLTNLVWTPYHTHDKEDRKTWVGQDSIFFDIDLDKKSIPFFMEHFSKKKVLLTPPVSLIQNSFEPLGIPKEALSIIRTGKGVHIYLHLAEPVTEKETLSQFKPTYLSLAKQLEETLNNNYQIKYPSYKCVWSVDVCAYDTHRVMRLPASFYKKKLDKRLFGVPTKVLAVAASKFDLEEYQSNANPSLAIEFNRGVQHDYGTLKHTPKPVQYVSNGNTITSTCNQLKLLKERPNDITEPMWYGAISILSRLGSYEEGKALCHEYSSSYEKYSKAETDRKVDKATSGNDSAKSCSYLRDHSPDPDACISCPFYKKIHKPLDMENIESEKNNFWLMKEKKDNKGNITVVYDSPDYVDLLKAYKMEPYIVDKSFGDIYKYRIVENGKDFWEMLEKRHKEAYPDDPKIFMKNVMAPSEDDEKYKFLRNKLAGRPSYLENFCKMVMLENQKDTYDLRSEFRHYIGMANGVYDIKNDRLLEDDPKYFILNNLPIIFNPKAECPFFDEFLWTTYNLNKDLLGYYSDSDRDKLIILTEDLMADILFTRGARGKDVFDMWFEKCFIFWGEGSNRKTTITNLIENIVGEDNCSTVPAGELDESKSLHLLRDMLVNIDDEAGEFSFLKNPEKIKTLVSGSRVTTPKIYKGSSLRFTPRCKYIFNSNVIPKFPSNAGIGENSGWSRRFIILPFLNTYEGDGGKILHNLTAELPGIFNRLILARKRLYKRGCYDEPDISKKLKGDRFETSCTVSMWLRDHTILLPKHHPDHKLMTVSGEKAWDNYKEYRDDNAPRGKGMVDRDSFKRKLSSVLKPLGMKGKVNNDYNDVGGRVEGYKGMVLKPSSKTKGFYSDNWANYEKEENRNLKVVHRNDDDEFSGVDDETKALV